MTSVKYLTYTTSQDAKESTKKFNNANIKMDGNKYFKFLSVHFDCFATTNPNGFRIGALIYSPHSRYGWLMLTDCITIKKAPEFLTTSFHDFLRSPGNEHLIQQIIADYTLCEKEDEQLNLFNVLAMNAIPFIPKQFLRPCDKVEAQKTLIKKEKRISKMKKWRKKAVANRRLKIQLKESVEKVEELKKYVKEQEVILESKVLKIEELKKSNVEVEGERDRMKQMIISNGVSNQEHRNKEMQYEMKLVEANKKTEELECIVKSTQSKIQKLEKNIANQNKTIETYTEQLANDALKYEKEMKKMKQNIRESEGALKASQDWREVDKKSTTSLILKLDGNINDLTKENARLREENAQLKNTTSFERQVNWTNDGLHLSYDHVNDGYIN